MDSIAKRLRFFREQKQLTMKELAAKIGVPESTYRDWEYGKSIRGEPYERLSQALSVSLTELITGRNTNTHSGEILTEIEKIKISLEKIRQTLNCA